MGGDVFGEEVETMIVTMTRKGDIRPKRPACELQKDASRKLSFRISGHKR